MTERVRAVSDRYGSVARTYRSFWAPVMVALSKPLIDALPIRQNHRLLDMGCGVGTIAADLSARAQRVVGVDAAEGMLRRAPSDRLLRVTGDLLRLPLADRSVDGAFSTFALQHVPFPGVALREAARALRPGGFVGTATWGIDHAESGGAYEVLDDVFARNEIPPESAGVKTWHARVDSTAKMRSLARRAGLTPQRAWSDRATYQWPRAHFLGWATTMGPYGRRLAAAGQPQRERAMADLNEQLTALRDADFLWEPLVVYLIAVND